MCWWPPMWRPMARVDLVLVIFLMLAKCSFFRTYRLPSHFSQGISDDQGSNVILDVRPHVTWPIPHSGNDSAMLLTCFQLANNIWNDNGRRWVASGDNKCCQSSTLSSAALRMPR